VMVNLVEAVEVLWLASPAYEADAVAVPTLVFEAYVTVGVVLKPKAPVTAAVHGVA